MSIKTIDLPHSLRPALYVDGHNIRTAGEWKGGNTGKGAGKKAAKAHAADNEFAAMIWKSGNVTIYAVERDGAGHDDLVRIRFVD